MATARSLFAKGRNAEVVERRPGLIAAPRRAPTRAKTKKHPSVFGSLMETAAYTAADDGDRDTARTFIAEAVDAAARLGADGNHRYTSFGSTGVGLYQLSIARVLGDSGTAIDHARRINPASIPSIERRARYWVDVARAYHQWGKPEHCYRGATRRRTGIPGRSPLPQTDRRDDDHAAAPPRRTRLPGLHAFARRTGTAA